MAGQRKSFPCGHAGKGKYCHRCAAAEAERQKVAQIKGDWQSRLRASPIPLDHLPKGVAENVLRVIEDLKSGKPYEDLKGKRLITMGQRDVISIPIQRRYRLICRDREGKIEPIEAITHEVYNSRLSSGGWPK